MLGILQLLFPTPITTLRGLASHFHITDKGSLKLHGHTVVKAHPGSFTTPDSLQQIQLQTLFSFKIHSSANYIVLILLRNQLFCCHFPNWLYVTMPVVGLIARVCLSLSNQFWSGYFLIHPMCRSHSANFWISFGGKCFLCSCKFGGKRWIQKFPMSRSWTRTFLHILCVCDSFKILVVNICCSYYMVLKTKPNQRKHWSVS